MGKHATGLPEFAPSFLPDEDVADPVASAIVRARAQWLRDEAERLGEAEAAWLAKAEKRLAISRIGAQRAESSLEQMRQRLEKVEAEFAARTAELASVRADSERERIRWHQSPMAAQVEKAARDFQFQRRVKIGLQLTRDFAWGALVVAVALLTAERALPVATGVWKHEKGSHSIIKPLLRQAGVEIDHLPHARVVIPVAKLRAKPSSTAGATASLFQGARVTVVGRRGRWILVRSGDGGDRQGWVQLSSLENTVP